MHRSSLGSIASSPRYRFRFLGAGLAAGALALCAVALQAKAFSHPSHHAADPMAQQADEAAFLRENDAAMAKMMHDMAAKPSGEVDRDFVAMMAPHHQGAIDMAVIELRYGNNEQLRRIAQEIIVGQMQEIAAMNVAVGLPVPASMPVPTQPTPATTSQYAPADFSAPICSSERK